MRFKDFFGVNYEHAEKEDIDCKIKALITAQELTGAEVDTLIACYNSNDMTSGDVPSKAGLGRLLDKGVLCQTAHKGNDYSFSVTYPLGFNVIKAMQLIGNGN